MDKYIFYFLMPLFSLILYATLSDDWEIKKNKRSFFIFTAYATFSCYIMISSSIWTENQTIRTIFSYETVIFSEAIISGLAVSVMRYPLTFIAIRTRNFNAVRMLQSEKIYLITALSLTVFHIVAGSIHFNNVLITSYDVNLATISESNVNQCSVGLVADVHLGCGANKTDVDRMCKMLNDGNYDMICIAGDVTDMTTFEEDLIYFAQEMGKVKTKYGIFAVEGNHEKDSLLPTGSILQKYGIVCLYDEAVTLENGITLVGRKDDSRLTAKEVLNRANITSPESVVVIQHIPSGMEEMKEENWLVICGHTHGYQFPFMGLINPMITDVPYGYLKKENLQIITTSGISAWGARIKWPSYNEITTIQLVY